MTILDQLAAYALKRVAMDKEQLPLEKLRRLALEGGKAEGAAFRKALSQEGISFLCEVKRASPSKGLIAPDFPYLDIARSYEEAGAEALSCLTEPKWFLGSDTIFREIRQAVHLPMLRKDFTVDEYQIYQAKVMGANAILLICALLDTSTIARYLELCHQLGLAALVEAHNEEEILSAVTAGAEIIGVNNRNLKDFSIDLQNAARMRDKIPPGTLYVAESGIQTPQDVKTLQSIGADGVLIGEALMRAPDKRAMLAQLRGTP